MENTSTLLKLPELRSYQSDLNDRIFARWRNHDRVMAVLPTGGGKSLLFGAVAANFANRDLRVLALAHREELIVQGAHHLQNWVNIPVGIIKSGHKFQPELAVQFASVQTVVNRLDRIGEFDLIIVDEAHHCTSDTYLSIFERFTTAKILGLTATPIRTDGSPFDHLFDCLEIGVTTAQLIAGGYLSPYKLFVDPNRMKTKGARTSMGDFSTSDLARMNDSIELAGNLVGSYQKYANGGTCMIFAINCEHSESIAAAYNQHGIAAIHLDAKTDKKIRARSLEALKTGDIKVISNVGLFGEGVDIPTLDCVQIARPTKSLAFHLQMVGRVLRKSAGKEFGIIIDHAGNCELLGLPDDEREWSLQGRPKREKDFDGADIIIDELERSERAIEVSDVELEEYVVSPTLQIWHQSLPRLLPATRDLFGLHSSPVEFKADSNQFIVEMFSPGLLKIGLNKSAEINRALSDIIGVSVEIELVLANR
ncbi:DEAD/DEAH box helicase [Chamaesiphon sp.]|uniref:DEAD/DEAH box helicase n=1 Tax=Chamaesiphon sp. TaxID=2814140 RepID=UPI0035932312